MFAGFLSKDMTYSCAIFSDLDGDLGQSASPDTRTHGRQPSSTSSGSSTPAKVQGDAEESNELYEAQIRKLDHVIKKARIWPGNRVLETGSGTCQGASLTRDPSVE